MSSEATPAEDNPEILLLTAEFSAKAKAKLDETELTNSLLGKEQAQALDQLKANDLIAEAEIIYQPAFMVNLLKRLPKSVERLNLIIE